VQFVSEDVPQRQATLSFSGRPEKSDGIQESSYVGISILVDGKELLLDELTELSSEERFPINQSPMMKTKIITGQFTRLFSVVEIRDHSQVEVTRFSGYFYGGSKEVTSQKISNGGSVWA
jgi:hypothetical protein